MYLYSFEKLDVFQNARNLVNIIYDTTELIPRTELYGISSQMKRAAISVMANVVEGNSRITNKDRANFMTISYSSLMELLSLILISLDRKFISDDRHKTLRIEIDKLSNQINALRKYQLNKKV